MQEMLNENINTCSLSCIELSLWNALWNVKTNKKKKKQEKKQKAKKKRQEKILKQKNPSINKAYRLKIIPVFCFLEVSLISLCLF